MYTGPTNLSGTAGSTETEAVFTWNAALPTDLIDSYDFTINSITTSLPANSTTFTATGLTDDIIYDVVLLVNFLDSSTRITTIRYSKHSPTYLPPKITNVVRVTDIFHAKIDWEAAEPIGLLSSYTIQIFDINTQTIIHTETLPSSSVTYTTNLLAGNFNYLFTLTANFADGHTEVATTHYSNID